MAINPDSNETSTMEKSDVIYEEHASPSPPNEIISNGVGAEAAMTWKTWLVIFILSSTFGLSFWPVPTTAAMYTTLAAKFDNPTSGYWFIPACT